MLLRSAANTIANSSAAIFFLSQSSNSGFVVFSLIGFLNFRKRGLQGFAACGFTFFECCNSLCDSESSLCFLLKHFRLCGELNDFLQACKIFFGDDFSTELLLGHFGFSNGGICGLLLLARIGKTIVALGVAFIDEFLNSGMLFLHVFEYRGCVHSGFESGSDSRVFHVLFERAQLIFFADVGLGE